MARLTGVLLISAEKLLDLLTNFTIWHLDIILGGTVVRHKGQETIVSDVKLSHDISIWTDLKCRFVICSYQLIFTTNDVGDLHVVGGWGQILQLLAGENVEGSQVNLSVTVLASLGGGHIDDLAWATLDDNESVLSQGGTLHREGGRGACIDGLEGVLMLKRGKSVPSQDEKRDSGEKSISKRRRLPAPANAK